jgi:hypothetical protein
MFFVFIVGGKIKKQNVNGENNCGSMLGGLLGETKANLLFAKNKLIFESKLKMGLQVSVSDILSTAKQLDVQHLDQLLRELNIIRVQKSGVPILDEAEAKLLQNINLGFDSEKWGRLKFLDWKSEFEELSPDEEVEALKLAEAYEEYSVERLKSIGQLAILRGTTIDEIMEQLGLNG